MTARRAATLTAIAAALSGAVALAVAICATGHRTDRHHTRLQGDADRAMTQALCVGNSGQDHDHFALWGQEMSTR